MTILPYAPPSLKPPGLRGRGFLAIAASLFLPGLGHALARRYRRGAAWFSVYVLFCLIFLFLAAFPQTVYIALALIPFSQIFQILILIDAYRLARPSPFPQIAHPALRYLAGIVLLALAIFLNPFAFLAMLHYPIETFVNPSLGMSPALNPGDRFICSKIAPIHRWSVVVIDAPPFPGETNPRYVKRIVGLPNETLEISPNGHILINGSPIPSPPDLSPYVGVGPSLRNRPGCTGTPITLGPDEYYVLGDNSPISADSRYFHPLPNHQPGAVPKDHILGPLTALYWPLNHIRRFN